MSKQEIWDLWIPDTAAQGISFARGRLDETEVMMVHAAPEKLTVDIYDEDGMLQAKGKDLPRTANTPMARLQRQGKEVIRDDIWPTENEYGLPVILAGGEVGILHQWWNDAEQQQWRWSLEFYNHR